MAKFLTTNGINYLIEEIIKSAKERVVLVSPYLKLNARIKELLADGYRPDLDIRIVYERKNWMRPSVSGALRSEGSVWEWRLWGQRAS